MLMFMLGLYCILNFLAQVKLGLKKKFKNCEKFIDRENFTWALTKLKQAKKVKFYQMQKESILCTSVQVRGQTPYTQRLEWGESCPET